MSIQLPIKPETLGRTSQGFCTPLLDEKPQVMRVPPRRVLPIVFLPGIMGSNLRMTTTRQRRLGNKNNIAWRPENIKATSDMFTAGPGRRQLQWDPKQTEVDTYDPAKNPTGDRNETADDRHKNSGPRSLHDPKKRADQIAKERGWTEIYLDSYRQILNACEEHLNQMIVVYGHAYNWWDENIVDVDPHEWQASKQFNLKPINREQLQKCADGCWFPVHAMGYNWLRSNREAGAVIAHRIEALIKDYQRKGFECEKVVIVTHSMGGLVARAVIHPEMGGLESRILGVVHGVMPAIGAAAAYRRIRCGFEEGFMHASPAARILGNHGSEVTAVLANSPGGLELLPSKQYGNGWLQLRRLGKIVQAWPTHGDPYEEIYKVRGKWYGLLVEDWINPSGLSESGIERSCELLNDARKFHDDIKSTYHPKSFAHYGSDSARPSWESVCWDLHTDAWAGHAAVDTEKLVFLTDDTKGKLGFRDTTKSSYAGTDQVAVQLADPLGAGDQTVPVRSADHQLQSGKFSGIFRQTGYEHQSSYQNDDAIKSTLYSLVRIIETMSWELEK